jgi:uncharacterized membrane protein YgdD (TMEM256/DUF423 family)
MIFTFPIFTATMKRFRQFDILSAGMLGFSGVALGAFGAHALKARLVAAGRLDAWETAVQYQLIHAVALLGVAWLARAGQNPRLARWLGRASRAWSAGAALFSGTLYWLALGGPRWLGPLTPLGGTLLLAGWGFVIAGAFAKGEK